MTDDIMKNLGPLAGLAGIWEGSKGQDVAPADNRRHEEEKSDYRERMVFELKHYQGLRLRTIGEMLNTTEETAKNTLFRATQKLRSALAAMR